MIRWAWYLRDQSKASTEDPKSFSAKALKLFNYGAEGQNRTADTGIFRPNF
jgi:hypothetical protein